MVVRADRFGRLPIKRVDQSGQEASFAFPLCGTITALSTPQPRVEQVPEGIAEHVEGVDGNRQAEPGPECQPGRRLHEPAPFPAEHPSPAGNLDRQTESQEAQRSLGNNHPPDVDAEDDDDSRHNIGQDMADQDLARGGAHSPGCQKIVILFNTDNGASDYS